MLFEEVLVRLMVVAVLLRMQLPVFSDMPNISVNLILEQLRQDQSVLSLISVIST